MTRSRPKSTGTRKRSGRVFRRDAKGRFASTGTTAAASSEAARLKRRVRRRRAALVGGAVAATAVAGQVHPASHTRTAITRRKLVKAHVARAATDHRKLVTRRARALPHRPTSGAAFPTAKRKAAHTEARTLTRGFRRQVKRARKARKVARSR